MLEDKKDLAFVKTMSILSKEFGIQTIAECVEDEDKLAIVRQIGLNYGQGYYIGKPAPELIDNKDIFTP